eukprot:SAG31_NODE_666_length_12962_cov_37.025033_6_plen_156_part_00
MQCFFSERCYSQPPVHERTITAVVLVLSQVCNNPYCTASFVLAAASLRPYIGLCDSEIATDAHWYNATNTHLRTCSPATVGGRMNAIVDTCALAAHSTGPGHFPSPAVPCSRECNSLIRAEETLWLDIKSALSSSVDRNILEAAQYLLQVRRSTD